MSIDMKKKDHRTESQTEGKIQKVRFLIPWPVSDNTVIFL